MEDGRPGSSSAPGAEVGETTISIFVKVPNGETIPLTLPTSTTVPTLLQLLSLRTSHPTSQLRLSHNGQQLSSLPAASSMSKSSPTLESLELPAGTTLTLTHQPPRTPKKIRCGAKECRALAQRIVGDCGFCGGHFCGNHRMLEDHRCSGLEDCKNQSREQNKIKLESERTVMVRGI